MSANPSPVFTSPANRALTHACRNSLRSREVCRTLTSGWGRDFRRNECKKTSVVSEQIENRRVRAGINIVTRRDHGELIQAVAVDVAHASGHLPVPGFTSVLGRDRLP